MITSIERRIRLSGMLILTAMLLEVASLLWLHPASFLVLHMVALGIFILGVAIYLFSLVVIGESAEK